MLERTNVGAVRERERERERGLINPQKILILALILVMLPITTVNAGEGDGSGNWFSNMIFSVKSAIGNVLGTSVTDEYGIWEYDKYLLTTDDYTGYAVTIKGYTQVEGVTEVIIPDEIDGVDVREISSGVFENCIELKKITMPNTVTTIGTDLFSGCTDLTNITLSKSLKSINSGTFSGCASLNSISIPSSVKGINASAFSGCTSLTNVIVPNSVTLIGAQAFLGCTNLTSVTLSNTLTSIGENAFDSCSKLTNIEIPNTVSYIYSGAFSNCTGLTNITIPDSVINISGDIFSGCTNLQAINVDENNNYYSSQNGILYNKTKTEIVRVPENFQGEITIPSTVTTIGAGAFSNCTGLTNTNMIIPSSVTDVSSTAFENCEITVYNDAFVDWNLSNAKVNLILTNDATSIESHAFNGCTELYSVIIPSSVTSIGDAAFAYCTNLSSVTISKGVKTIGENAFRGCTSLTSIKIPAGVTSIGKNAFTDTGKVTADFPENITTINATVMGDYNLLEAIILPETVTTIEDNAFSNCQNLKSITIPASVTSIGVNVFKGCANLTEINVDSNNTKYCSEDGVLYDYYKEKLICCPKDSQSYNQIYGTYFYHIIDGVQYIETGAFIKEMTGVDIPESVIEIKTGAFISCDNVIIRRNDIDKNIKLNIENNAFSTDTVLHVISGSSAYDYAKENNLEWYSIIDYDYDYIVRDVYVNGKKLLSIHPGYYFNIEQREEIKIPKLRDISYSNNLEVILGDTNIDINNIIFYEDTDGLVTYVKGFNDCANLEYIKIPSKNIIICDDAFLNCNENLVIEAYEGSQAHEYAIANNLGFKKIEEAINYEIIDDENKYVKVTGGDIEKLYGLVVIPTTVEIDGTTYTVTEIAENAFKGNTKITGIRIPNTVENIGANAFENCTALTNVKVDAESIGEGAFYNCTSLSNVNIGANVKTIENRAFSYIAENANVTISDSVTSIGTNAFTTTNTLNVIVNSVAQEYAIENDISYKLQYSINHYKQKGKVGEFVLEAIETFYAAIDTEVTAKNKTYENYTYDSNISNQSGTISAEEALELNLYYIGNEYNITYNLNGGTNSEESATSYIYGIGTQLKEPTRQFYTFNGWYENADFTGEPISAIPAERAGDITLYAKWSNKYEPWELALLDDGTIEVISYIHIEGVTEVEIPSIVEGINVTSIKESIFAGCTELVSITIPDTVTNIGAQAFLSCTSLTGIKIPSAVKNIGDNAFRDCTALTNVEIQNGVTTIGNYAFCNCTGLREITIPDSVETIDSTVFSGCSDELIINFNGKIDDGDDGDDDTPYLTFDKGTGTITKCNTSDANIEIPEKIEGVNVYNIGEGAFADCTYLESIEFPSTLKSIKADAFNGCIRLMQVDIPVGVTSIGANAFAGCISLTDVTIPVGVKKIADSLFSGCKRLVNISLPEGITTIGKNAFDGCKNLTEIILPESTTKIDNEAFKDCGSLKLIYIPDNTTTIAENAFDGCNAITIFASINSYAIEYAKKNGIPWTVDGTPNPTPTPVTAIYTINHYLQNADNDNYTIDSTSTETKSGVVGEYTEAVAKEYAGFKVSTPIRQTTIAEDGSTVVDVYYTRNSYTLTLSKDDNIASVSGAGTYKHGAQVNIGAVLKEEEGYRIEWEQWTSSDTSVMGDLAEQNTTITMPISDVTLTAQALKQPTDTPVPTTEPTPTVTPIPTTEPTATPTVTPTPTIEPTPTPTSSPSVPITPSTPTPTPSTGDYGLIEKEDNKFIKGIGAYTNWGDAKLKFTGYTSLFAKRANGESLNDGDRIGTGTKITINDKTYTAVVTGDVTGEGKLNVSDLIKVINLRYNTPRDDDAWNNGVREASLVSSKNWENETRYTNVSDIIKLINMIYKPIE